VALGEGKTVHISKNKKTKPEKIEKIQIKKHVHPRVDGFPKATTVKGPQK